MAKHISGNVLALLVNLLADQEGVKIKYEYIREKNTNGQES